MQLFKTLSIVISVCAIFFSTQAFAKHKSKHHEDIELKDSSGRAFPTKHKDKKEFREKTKIQIAANQGTKREQEERRRTIKKQLSQEKKKKKEADKKLEQQQKAAGIPKKKRKKTVIAPQQQVTTLQKEFQVCRNASKSKKLMKRVRDLKQLYPYLNVPTMTLHATKVKKKRSGGKKKKERVYILGQETRYQIKEI